MPCGTQIVATEPLGERWREVLPSDHCVEDCNYLLDYYRLSADKRLLYGGGVVYGARDPAHIESKLRPRMLKTFPQLESVRIDYAWTGNFLLTLSRLPDVGRLAENIYYSQGCSGHGVTFTHLIGRVLSEAILGRPQRMAAFETPAAPPVPRRAAAARAAHRARRELLRPARSARGLRAGGRVAARAAAYNRRPPRTADSRAFP